jgi:hypothetical protein
MQIDQSSNKPAPARAAVMIVLGIDVVFKLDSYETRPGLSSRQIEGKLKGSVFQPIEHFENWVLPTENL